MALLTSSTTFTIQAAEAYEESVDLVLLPQNATMESLRELHYPGDLFPPIIYPDMPDRWENFDTAPLTAAPLSQAEKTLSGNKYSRWPGKFGDRPVKEYWLGGDAKARVSMDFFRRLAEYFFNPPDPPNYITWWPKDRTATGYNAIIEDLSLGGGSVLTFDYIAVFNGVLTGELVLTLRLISEVVS